MRTFKDDAIIIRTQKLGEADRIIIMATRDHGLLHAVAKGVRKTKSKFGARLEPFMQVNAMFYAGKSMPIITEVSVKYQFAKMLMEPEKFNIASQMLELQEKLSIKDDSMRENQNAQFHLLSGALYALCTGKYAPLWTLNMYAYRMVSLSGWRPELEACVECGKLCEKMTFSSADGGLVCAHHSPQTPIYIDDETQNYLTALPRNDWQCISTFDIQHNKLVNSLLLQYIEHHSERRIRSTEVFVS
jgi:DNA repair protein RecO (recombination protein O)